MITKTFQSREEYFEYDALNYSYLKAFDKNPEAPREGSLTNRGMIYGSALDCLLFDGKEKFEKEYTFMTETEPTASLKTLYEAIMEDYSNDIIKEDDIDLDYLYNKSVSLGLWSSIKKKELVLVKFTPSFIDYISESIKAKGKQILTSEEYNNIITASREIKDICKHTKWMFNLKHYDQLAFAFTVMCGDKRVEMKCMLDLVVIDDEHKVIYPVDLKTMSDEPSRFLANFISFRYDLQAEQYLLGLKSWATENGYSDYIISDFMYIVSSQQAPNRPYLYKIRSPKEMRKTMEQTSPFKYNGLKQIVDNYLYCQEHGFEYPRELQEGGMICL